MAFLTSPSNSRSPLSMASRTRTAKPRGALSIEDAVTFYESNGSRVRVLDHCSLDVSPGEICVVVGPSGCGKTTLLRGIAGFHGLTEGTIRLDGEMLCGPGREKAPVGPDRVVVFQNGALFPWKTNLDNVAFGPIVQRTIPRAEAYAKARERMAAAGLSGYEHAYPGETSSGVKRRIEIVRALMNDPTVLLLDEPFRALDSLTRSIMHAALLDAHARNQVTTFFITHDIAEAVFLGRKVVIMTSRPCRPKKILDVDAPYPREAGWLADRRFRELVREATAAVSEEAERAFAHGERES